MAASIASGLGGFGAWAALYVSLSSRATKPMRTWRNLAEVVHPLYDVDWAGAYGGAGYFDKYVFNCMWR